MEDELCLAIGQRVRQEQQESAEKLQLKQKEFESRREPDVPILADQAVPAILADFRLLNRYAIQKRPKKSGRIGAKRKKLLEPVTPELIDALSVGEGRLAAALALDRFYKEAA
jgi:hypothetical protein